MRRSVVILGVVALLAAAPVGVPASARSGRLEVVAGRGSKAPSFVGGIRDRARRGGAVDAARAHLAANRSRYHIEDPGSSLRRIAVTRDGAHTTVRFGQVYRGIEVFGAQYLVHMSRTPGGYAARSVNGHYFTALSTPTRPRFGSAVAARLAGAYVRPAVVTRVTPHGLSVVPTKTGVLAYHFTVSAKRFGAPVEQEVFVNARNGSLALTYSGIEYANGPTTGTGVNAHGDTVPLEIWHKGGSYSLRDQSRDMFDPSDKSGQIVTHNANGSPDNTPTLANVVRSPSDTFTGRPSNTGAVDAHWGAGQVYEFYKDLGRNSIDNKGLSIVSVVNAAELNGSPMYNAFWDGSKMTYGYPHDGQVYPLSADLDVVGHELTHGVTQYTADLVYLNQSGAMNEAYSDYFGNAIDDTVSGTPKSDPSYAFLGEDLCIVPNPANWQCPLRNMDDGMTTNDYVRYLPDVDGGGVHLNSTVYSGALWNIRESNSVGESLSDQIVYEALRDYVTPLDNFVDGRIATVAAAQAHSGVTQQQVDAVRRAFADQGIVPGWDSAVPSDARVIRHNVAPLGFFFSPPQVSGEHYAMADYKKLTQLCCAPEQIFVGRVDGRGKAVRVGELFKKSTVNDELPDISGRTAVWAHFDRSGDFDVHGRSFGTKLGHVKSIAGDNASWDWFPSIDGRLVAWERLDLRTGGTDVYARYLGTKRKIPVTTARGDQYQPQVYGNWVAYWNVRNDTIGAKNLKTGKSMTVHAGPKALIGPPGVGGGFLYWYQDSNFGGRRADFRGGIKRIKLGGRGVQNVVREGRWFSPYWSGFSSPPVPSANHDYVAFSDEFGYSGKPGIPTGRVGRDVLLAPATGGRPVSVTKNRGDQAWPAMSRGRRVVWLDSSQARTDLVRRKVPKA